jgi:NADH dehydrogenase
VEIFLGTKVSEVNGTEVVLSNGERIITNTLIWTAGTAPNPMLNNLPCEKDRGRLCADEFMQVKDFPGVWALGDCASITDPKTGKTYPPTAQHALRQGKVLANNIRSAIRGGKKKPFAFETIGQLAALGRRTGVAQIFGLNFSGFFAWWLWRTIYLMKLPRFEKKLRVAFDWTLDLVFHKDPVQFLTLRAPTVSESEIEAA